MMDDERNVVNFAVHEGVVACLERTIRRLWITTLVLIILLVATNGLWLWYESQFEYFTITQESETGTNNYIGNDGDINYGETNGNR